MEIVRADFQQKIDEIELYFRFLDMALEEGVKLENPRKCNPTIKTLEKISAVLGKKLKIAFN